MKPKPRLTAVQVTLILDCDGYEVADAVNEILREHQRSFAPGSTLLDYAVGTGVNLGEHDHGYLEGDAFVEI